MLTFFEQQGEDLTPLLESTSLHEEFLRDPSYWMQADEVEKFLETASKTSHFEGALFQKIGHLSPELRSWGVLDSVLRMMPKPQEILAQPERFLSYFVSPAPPIDHLVRTESSIEFDLPVSSMQYPLVTSFLKSAFESIPVYVGRPFGQCSWENIHLKFQWSEEQNSIFADEDLGHQISPDLLRSVVASLEKHQRELEEKNRDLQARNEQLLQSQREIEKELSEKVELHSVLGEPVHKLEFIDQNSIEALRQNFSKLGDYMVRAQQLITMLVAQDRMSPAVKQAMKKVDWDRVKQQFPETIQESRKILDQTQKQHEVENHV